MEAETLSRIVEAIVLTSPGPVRAEAVHEALAEDGVSASAVEEALASLQSEWEEADRALRLERVASGWRAVTVAQLDPYLRAFHGVTARQRLSQAALEVLSIVAHREPVTLPEVNFIRGANSASVVRTLLDRKLLRVAGRKRVVGKPFLYRTTKDFLIHFGLESVNDLPDPEELLRQIDLEISSS
jgi:segregation and condensation protein B